MLPPIDSAWRKVSQLWLGKLCSMTAPQRMSTFTPEYVLPVAAFFGMASGAFAAAAPQGWTQGSRPASSSPMILSVISS
jgi:hypothetical protein